MEKYDFTPEQFKEHVDQANKEIQRIICKHIAELKIDNTSASWMFAGRVANFLVGITYGPVFNMTPIEALNKEKE